jgi:iron complex transport system ATP-binding protein
VSAALLESDGLSITVPGRTLIAEFSASFGSGEFVALLGGNGAGKSLLLRTLAGLRAPAQGNVRLGSASITTLPRREIALRLGFLPQDPDATPQGALAESVLLGRFAHLGLLEAPGAADDARVIAALSQAGLESLSSRELATLSGGEQRRAAIARLLVQAPTIYLLDEPTNHLDPAQQLAILGHLRGLAAAGALVIASLHDPNLALRFSDRALLLAGDGAATLLPTSQLDAARLGALYGVPFVEARVGAHRIVSAE